LLLIGEDEALARQTSADGVHLRARDLPKYGQSPIQNLIVSAACHSLDELQLAHKAGARVAFLSPVFETASHPGAPPLGASRFKELAAQAPLPVLALGGVDAQNAHQLAGENVAGLGAIGAFYRDGG